MDEGRSDRESTSLTSARRHNAVWHSISFKMALAMAVILAVVLSLATFLSLRYEADLEYREVEDYTNRVAELVMQSFDSKAVGTTPFHTRYLAAKLLELPRLHNLRVVAIEGTIQFSRNPDEIGQPLDLANRDVCDTCHASEGVLSEEKTYRNKNGGFLYHLPYPIPNQPKCLRCHKPEFKHLGTLVVEMEIDSTLDKIFKHSFSMIGGAIIALVLALIGIMISFRWLVKSPLSNLQRDMQKVEYGDFRVGPVPESKGEISELYEYFISMTRRLEQVQSDQNALVKEKSAKVADLSQEIRSIYSNLIRMEHLSAVGTLSAQVVHEIRTPLNALNLNLQLLHRSLLDHPDMDDDSKDLAANIGKEVERISLILDKFMDRARRPRSKPTMESLHDLISEVVALMEWEAKKVSVEFQVDVPEDIQAVLMHADEFRQILINLFANAMNAMPDGGKIRITAEKVDHTCNIEVSDTGCGINREDLENIFKPFFTTRERGTGLGLAIVKQIVEGMGGEIRVESEVGEGTRFLLDLKDERPSSREET